MNKINKFLSGKFGYSSSSSTQKIIVIILIIMFVLSIQHSNNLIDSTIGKFIILLICICLTIYNTVAGLVATLITLGVYSYYNKKIEGMENAVPTNAKSSNILMNIKPDKVESYTKDTTHSTFSKPTTPIPVTATNSQIQTNMLKTEQQMRPKNSGTIPALPTKNANVAPSSKESFVSVPSNTNTKKY
jgi:hypothetical protein